MIDMPVDRLHPHLSKGYAYVEFETVVEAEKGLKHMDGGQIDGQVIIATAVLALPSQDAFTTLYVATHPIPHKEKVSVTTETLSGSPQNSSATGGAPALTRQLELLQVELPGTPDLTAPLLPHFPFLHWKSLYQKFYPASYPCVLPSTFTDLTGKKHDY